MFKPRKNNPSKKKNKQKKMMVQRPYFLAPPLYKAQEVRSWKIRYICTTATSAITGGGLTATNLGQMVGGIAATTTLAYYLSNVVRLKRISVWGAVATAGTPVQVGWEWSDNPTTSFASPTGLIVDESVSFDRPAFITVTPPRNSFASMWKQQNDTNSIGDFILPLGAVVDFDLQFIIDDNEVPLQSFAIVAGTVGTYYHRIINLVGSGVLTPINALNSI